MSKVAGTDDDKSIRLSAEERRRLYNETVRKANLVNIFLSKVDFHVDREMLSKPPRPGLNYGSEIDSFQYDEETGGFLVSVKWRVDMKSSRKSVAKCVAVYDILYDGLVTSNEEVLKIFADSVATSATYSYFRAFFATLDCSAQLGLPPLPVLKLFPKV